MKRIIVILSFSLLINTVAQAWTNAIHAGTAAIAEANLTPKAKAEISKLFDGESIVMYASWMADMEEEKGMEEFASWHKVAVNAKNAVITAKKLSKSKSKQIAESNALAVSGYEKTFSQLVNRDKLSKEEVKKNLLCLIHILTDIHCPANYLFEDMPDVDNIHVTVDGRKVPYQKIWQAGALTMTFTWTAREYVHQLSRLNASQVEAITSGSFTSWVKDMAVHSRKVLAMGDNGKVFNKNQYRLFLNPVADEAVNIVTKAGYRTARVLNGLFDSEVKNVSFK